MDGRDIPVGTERHLKRNHLEGGSRSAPRPTTQLGWTKWFAVALNDYRGKAPSDALGRATARQFPIVGTPSARFRLFAGGINYAFRVSPENSDFAAWGCAACAWVPANTGPANPKEPPAMVREAFN
jgi:hypothetical protein